MPEHDVDRQHLPPSLRHHVGLSRRQWLRSAAGAAAGLVAAPYTALAQSGRRPPNIILILADDLGSRDLGCFGADDLITSNLDSLAANGVRFEQFYITAPACLPSRVSLLTGRHPQHFMEGGIGMVSSAVTLAELLGASGYDTAVYGKWHLGHGADVSPNGQGFGHFVLVIHLQAGFGDRQLLPLLLLGGRRATRILA